MKKRLVCALVALLFMFTSIIGRCLYISLTRSDFVSEGYNSYKLDIGVVYNNIYDCKGRKLNNLNTEKVALIEPNEKCMNEIEMLFDNDSSAEIRRELSNGYPIIKTTEKTAQTRHIVQYDRIIENSESMLAKHLLSREYGGLEMYLGDPIGSLSVNYSMNARGDLLEGDSIYVNNYNYDTADGVVISLDKNIQQIAEDASKSIGKGAVVILDCDTSKILACVSRGGDYINRALGSYAVGSIFKLTVCACALENGVSMNYKCEGEVKIGDTVFHCQKGKAHGNQNMKQALANSCNCYFIQLANELGGEKLYKTAKNLGFGSDFEIYEDWSISGGALPSLNDLNSFGELSLFGFGQGKLTDTPLHFASVIASVANGGEYNFPTLEIKETEGESVLSQSTASTLRSYMKYVVTDGTGTSANYKNSTAGKTSTAQSGRYVDGKEVLNTFFAGFYPYENPEFAIVIMCEDGRSGAEDCCPVFRTIVENLDKM